MKLVCRECKFTIPLVPEDLKPGLVISACPECGEMAWTLTSEDHNSPAISDEEQAVIDAKANPWDSEDWEIVKRRLADERSTGVD